MVHLVSWLVQIGSALIRWTLLVCSGKVWLCGAEEKSWHPADSDPFVGHRYERASSGLLCRVMDARL